MEYTVKRHDNTPARIHSRCLSGRAGPYYGSRRRNNYGSLFSILCSAVYAVYDSKYFEQQ